MIVVKTPNKIVAILLQNCSHPVTMWKSGLIKLTSFNWTAITWDHTCFH